MSVLSPHVTVLTLGIANAYVIRGSQGVTLFDTGSVASPLRVERHLSRLGLHVRDLRHIIVSHAHYDHAGGAAALQVLSGAEVWAHHLDAPLLERGEQAPRAHPSQLSVAQRVGGWVLRGEQPAVSVHRRLTADEVLVDVPGQPRVIHLPGHTPGMIGLWWAMDALLLGADVATHFLPWALTPPVAAYTPDPPEARRSMLRAAELNARVLGLGHGSPVVGTATQQLQRLAMEFGRPGR